MTALFLWQLVRECFQGILVPLHERRIKEKGLAADVGHPAAFGLQAPWSEGAWGEAALTALLPLAPHSPEGISHFFCQAPG